MVELFAGALILLIGLILGFSLAVAIANSRRVDE